MLSEAPIPFVRGNPTFAGIEWGKRIKSIMLCSFKHFSIHSFKHSFSA